MKSVFAILLLSLAWTVLILCFGVFSGLITIKATAPWLLNPAALAYRHLKLSIVPFGALFILYFWLIARMKRLLDQPGTKLSQLSFYDRLLNATISTFFGVGVIWTAIGMETALMQAVSGMDQGAQAVAKAGAWGLLNKLVNGGLLLALSTTVFGGTCGYTLKILKIVLLGKKWDAFILEESESNG